MAINPSVDDYPSDIEQDEDYQELLKAVEVHFEEDSVDEDELDLDEEPEQEPQPLPDGEIGISFQSILRKQHREQLLQDRQTVQPGDDRRPIRVHIPENPPPSPLPPDPRYPDQEAKRDNTPRYPTATPTQIAIYTWMRVCRVPKECYQLLMRIQRAPWFVHQELPLSYSALQTFAKFLPTDTIYSHEVEVDDEEGDSSTQSTADCFFFKIEDLVSRALRNPQIFDHCHFGLAKEEDPIIESFNATIGGVWSASAVAAKSAFPVKPPTWRNKDGLLISRNLMVFAGATVLAHMGVFLMPIRVTGLFTSDRIWSKYATEGTTEKGQKVFKSTAMNKVWVSFNPILVSLEDLDFFGIKEQESRQHFLPDMGEKVGNVQKGIPSRLILI